MAGLVPAICGTPNVDRGGAENVDHRDKPGDERLRGSGGLAGVPRSEELKTTKGALVEHPVRAVGRA
jgi:hypothetical protein